MKGFFSLFIQNSTNFAFIMKKTWDKNEVNFYCFKATRNFRGQEEQTRKNFTRSFPHSIHKDFLPLFPFPLYTKIIPRWKEWREGKFMKQFHHERTSQEKSGEASMWTRGRKFYYIHFFSVFMWQASNRAKLPFDEALKGKTNWKTFFRTLLATGLVFFGWGGWNWRNVLWKLNVFCICERSLLHEGVLEGWVTNIRFMFWEIVRNLHTHTRVSSSESR